MFQHLSNMLWKLRGVIRDQSNLTPGELNIAEREEGVKRVTLPDSDDYDDTLEAMSACETCELRLNELHEAACALCIRHKYNHAVVDSFLGNEYFGSEKGRHHEGQDEGLREVGHQELGECQCRDRIVKRHFRQNGCQET